jgi:hypothetical protein
MRKEDTMNHYRVTFYTEDEKMREEEFYSEEKNIIFAVRALLKRHDTTVVKIEKLEGDLTKAEKELGLILEGQEMTLQINKLNQFLNILLS